MNFQYYKTTPLVGMIAILIVIAHLLIAVLGPIITALLPGKFMTEIETIADYIGIFSVLGIVGVVLFIVDSWVWRFWFFRWLIDIPNLNGRYKGKLISDFNGALTKDAILEICQTASEIKVCGYFADENSLAQTSTSCSISEVLVKKTNGKFSLVYLFSNSPNQSTNHVYQHGGTVTLDYHADIKTLTGEYYNKRKNHGTICVEYEQSKLLGRFKR
jgi:hypothetical protein